MRLEHSTEKLGGAYKLFVACLGLFMGLYVVLPFFSRSYGTQALGIFQGIWTVGVVGIFLCGTAYVIANMNNRSRRFYFVLVPTVLSLLWILSVAFFALALFVLRRG